MQQIQQDLAQNPQVQQQMQTNPQLQQGMKQEADNLAIEIEARKAVLIAEMTEEFLCEEKKVSGDFGNDPIAKLRARELDLKAQDNLRKQKEDEARINIDKSKILMNKDIQEDKMDQNQDLALLRAATSLEKQKMSNQAKMRSDVMKRKDVKTLKGPRS